MVWREDRWVLTCLPLSGCVSTYIMWGLSALCLMLLRFHGSAFLLLAVLTSCCAGTATVALGLASKGLWLTLGLGSKFLGLLWLWLLLNKPDWPTAAVSLK